MITQLSLRSENAFEMKEGTLYPLLHALEKEDLLSSCEKETESGRKRRYYHLTEKGIRELAAQRAQWQAFSAAVDKVVGAEILAC